MTLNVVDLSNNNAPSDIKNYPADAYIFKATEGTNFTDSYCDKLVQQCIKRNIPFGVYHFMDGSNWQKQADHFINATKGYVGKGLLVLDYEMYGRQGTAIAKKWLDYVTEKTGVKPLLYTSQSVTNEENWSAVVKADYGLWVAQYASKLGKVGYWSTVAMWQYTSTPYDKSYFYGTRATWDAYAGKKGAEKVSKPTYQKEIGWYKVVKDDVFYKEKELKNKSGWKTKVGQTIYIPEVVNYGKTTRGKVMLAKHYR